MRRIPISLFVGDALVLLAVTLVGFANHGSSLAGTRWLTSFLPLCLAWAAAAPWLGLYDAQSAGRMRNFWRPAFAALLAAPLAALLRALWLQASIPTSFVLALGAAAALGLTLWRLLWAGWFTRKAAHG